jgi:hypothetical protein
VIKRSNEGSIHKIGMFLIVLSGLVMLPQAGYALCGNIMGVAVPCKGDSADSAYRDEINRQNFMSHASSLNPDPAEEYRAAGRGIQEAKKKREAFARELGIPAEEFEKMATDMRSKALGGATPPTGTDADLRTLDEERKKNWSEANKATTNSGAPIAAPAAPAAPTGAETAQTASANSLSALYTLNKKVLPDVPDNSDSLVGPCKYVADPVLGDGIKVQSSCDKSTINTRTVSCESLAGTVTMLAVCKTESKEINANRCADQYVAPLIKNAIAKSESGNTSNKSKEGIR